MADLSQEDYSIAYDAWLDGRAFDGRMTYNFEALVEQALLAYDERHPGAASAPFFSKRCGGKDYANHKMDVYCTFCRGLLVSRIPMAASPTANPRVKKHTTGCALACLAGRRAMKSPSAPVGLTDEDLTL